MFDMSISVFESSLVVFTCIDDSDLQIICPYISQKSTIKAIKWQCSCSDVYPRVCRQQIRSQGLLALKSLFDPQLSSSVKSLDLTNCGLRSDVLFRLLGILQNSNIRHLWIKSVGLTDAVSGQLSALLGEMGRLESLDLSRNFITGKTIDLIATPLRFNSTLVTLDVSFNPLGTRGMRTLLDSIRKPCRLVELRAQFCESSLFRDPELISNLLHEDTSLKRLNLAGNRLSSEDRQRIHQLNQENSADVDEEFRLIKARSRTLSGGLFRM